MAFLKGVFGSSKVVEEGTPEADKAQRQVSGKSVPPVAPTQPQPSTPAEEPLNDGPPDFEQVLDRAGVTAEQRTRVKKAQELLKSLPADAAPVLKRQIVEAAFRAFDIPTPEIVRAAASEIEALNSYVSGGAKIKERALEEGNAKVKDLERQIAEVRAQTDRAVAAQEAREVATKKEIARVKPVVDFFAQGTADAPSAPAPSAAPSPPPSAAPSSPMGPPGSSDDFEPAPLDRPRG